MYNQYYLAFHSQVTHLANGWKGFMTASYTGNMLSVHRHLWTHRRDTRAKWRHEHVPPYHGIEHLVIAGVRRHLIETPWACLFPWTSCAWSAEQSKTHQEQAQEVQLAGVCFYFSTQPGQQEIVFVYLHNQPDKLTFE